MTASGYQTFLIRLSGSYRLELPTFEFATQQLSPVTSVEVSSPDDCTIAVKVTFTSVASEQQAANIAELIAVDVADRLAHEYHVAASDPEQGEASFNSTSSDGSSHHSLSHSLSFVQFAHVTLKKDESEIPTLRAILERPQTTKDAYYGRFRWILQRSDPVARFMHLYSILLSLAGGPNHTQRSVDAFITANESGVQTVFNSHQNRHETIYTRLRNEVGHELPNTTPQSTQDGMEQHIDRLIDHVKAAIAALP